MNFLTIRFLTEIHLLFTNILYRVWMEQFDRCFADPGSVLMKGEVNTIFCFEAHFEKKRHPHYGRFLRPEHNRIVEMAWVNADGIKEAETVLIVEFTPHESGTQLRLAHAGKAHGA